VSLNQHGGSEPIPDSALMNDQINPQFSVQANKTYFLRIINISGFAQFYLHIPNHNFTIIETDGIYTQPTHAQDLYLANGQRYGVLLKTHPTSTQNFPILGSMDLNGFDSGSITPELQQNVTGALVYNCKHHRVLK
jgi:iron transport multicopper oxidase